MAEFNVRADEVNVEQIMHQIRARIREKRGVDYTEEQIQELAKIKLEKFLDPRGVRSDLLEQFQRSRRDGPPADLRVRRPDADPIGQPAGRLHPPAAPARAEAVLQPEPARAGAALPDADQPLPPRSRRARRPGLRGDAQPRGRDDPHRHRGEEHEDARRVDCRPARLQRAARARARGGRAVQARGAHERGAPAAGRGLAAGARRSAAKPRRSDRGGTGARLRRGERHGETAARRARKAQGGTASPRADQAPSGRRSRDGRRKPAVAAAATPPRTPERTRLRGRGTRDRGTKDDGTDEGRRTGDEGPRGERTGAPPARATIRSSGPR